MACRSKCLTRSVLTLSIYIFTFHVDCPAWELQTDSHDITVEKGVESNIDFYLSDYRSLNVTLRLIVQHRSPDGVFINKCQIEHSDTGVCHPAFGPCECIGESSGSYRYRLRMNFTEQDGGQWVFHIVNHEKTCVNITVIQPSQVTVITPPSIGYTLLTVALTSLVLFIIISSIISLVAVLRWRSRSQRTLVRDTEQRITVAGSRSRESQPSDDSAWVEQAQCEFQSSMTVTSCDMQKFRVS